MKICVIGYLGNMGQRYCRILEHLGHQWIGTDACESHGFYDFVRPTKEADAVIIASPTRAHADQVRVLKDCGLPILCEKPLTKDLVELEKLLEDLKFAGTRLQMVSQYDYIYFPKSVISPTIYNYFKHGSDGIYWDCINIIYHASDIVILRETSPIWYCQINGYSLKLADMDHAYITMVDWWLKDPKDDLGRIWNAHKKAHDLEAACNAS